MAIETQIINGSFTEIYTNEGGNWLTQAAPTNFHQFFRRKILTSGEQISDFREVTEAEKSALEEADANFTEPDAEFVSRCESLGVTFNQSTGFFELNGLTDITETQMRVIVEYGSTDKWIEGLFAHSKIRTNISVLNLGNGGSISIDNLCNGCSEIEIFVFPSRKGYGIFTGSNLFYTFSKCRKLKAIKGDWTISSIKAEGVGAFGFCNELEEIDGLVLNKGIKKISFRDSPKLKLSTIQGIVSRSMTESCAITLHPDAYARLTDEIIAEAAEKQITFATT